MLGKHTLTIHLHGLTDHPRDTSIDTIQNQLIPFLKNHYQIDNELSMNIISRGYLPQGGGHIRVVIPTIRKFTSINLPDKGYIKRVRGTVAGSKLSTSILNNVKDVAKGQLL